MRYIRELSIQDIDDLLESAEERNGDAVTIYADLNFVAVTEGKITYLCNSARIRNIPLEQDTDYDLNVMKIKLGGERRTRRTKRNGGSRRTMDEQYEKALLAMRNYIRR